MNNRDDSDELWDDLLDDVASADFRRTLLAETVGAAARRRRRRLIGAVACVVAPVALLALMQAGRLKDHTPELAAVRASGLDSTSAVVSAETPKADIEETGLKPDILTDDELFAMFPDHVVALVGPAGNQRLVVLGERSK